MKVGKQRTGCRRRAAKPEGWHMAESLEHPLRQRPANMDPVRAQPPKKAFSGRRNYHTQASTSKPACLSEAQAITNYATRSPLGCSIRHLFAATVCRSSSRQPSRSPPAAQRTGGSTSKHAAGIETRFEQGVDCYHLGDSTRIKACRVCFFRRSGSIPGPQAHEPGFRVCSSHRGRPALSRGSDVLADRVWLHDGSEPASSILSSKQKNAHLISDTFV